MNIVTDSGAVIAALNKRVVELELMLESRTREVDKSIARYNKSVSKQRDIIKEQQARIAELEKEPEFFYEEAMDSKEQGK